METQFIPRTDDDDHGKLSPNDFDACPFTQFKLWYAEASVKEKNTEPNSMAIATVSEDGKPSVRYMLLKYYDDARFVFFTNYESRIGKELDANPRVSAAFYWPSLDRQVRIEGVVKKCDHAFNEQYFGTRDTRSKLATIYSHQSEELSVKEKEEFIKKVNEDVNKKLGDLHVPANWGGYEIIPDSFEFWVGQRSRMHDRFSYKKSGEKEWKKIMLYP